ncbi:MAG: acyclic terpene utilization AtuA family protein [Paracoccaceae bacterium]
MAKSIRIGGASGFWGESAMSTPQLLAVEGLDYLVYDYLAEITMSIMARARMKDANAGYAADFVTDVMTRNLKTIAAKGVKVLSNAGGVNPVACGAALQALVAELGLSLKVAVVEGDDILDRAEQFAARKEMFSAADMPPRDRLASMNAYIGAGPIVAALQAGADIVITGRCVDSAVTLAAAMHAFGWGADDLDLLAAGSLAGHLLECGPQSTGGNFTDWQAAGDIAQIGYPVAEMRADGTFAVFKPDGTTGVVSPASVAEQMLYEIGDPRAYILPDVVCDFSDVTITQDGPDRVEVAGAAGYPPTGQLKVSATWMDGFRAGQVVHFNGVGARDKAVSYAEAALSRARNVLAKMGASDYREVSVETFGGRPGEGAYEEISLKAAVRHDDARAVGLFLKEFIGGALATPPGLHFFTGGGRPKPSPVVSLFSFLVEASTLDLKVTLDGKDIDYVAPEVSVQDVPVCETPAPQEIDARTDLIERPLEALAWARSGDKGDKANIGVIARHAAYMPWIWASLTPEVVKTVFGDLVQGEVERFYLPGTHSMNLLLHEALGGGGVTSLRNDAQAKAYAQRLLATPIHLPAGLIVNEEGAA